MTMAWVMWGQLQLLCALLLQLISRLERVIAAYEQRPGLQEVEKEENEEWNGGCVEQQGWNLDSFSALFHVLRFFRNKKI